MKQLSIDNASSELGRVCDEARDDRVVLMRGGKPVAMVLGLQNYDEEDLGYMTDPEFWRMIRERRAEDSGIPLAEVKRRISAAEAMEKAQRAKMAKKGRAGRRTGARTNGKLQRARG